MTEMHMTIETLIAIVSLSLAVGGGISQAISAVIKSRSDASATIFKGYDELVKNLQQQVEMLKKRVCELQEDNDALRQQVAGLEQRIQQMGERVVMLEEENARLRACATTAEVKDDRSSGGRSHKRRPLRQDDGELQQGGVPTAGTAGRRTDK